MKEQEVWIKDLENLHLPRFNELPQIPLYLDQVIEYTNTQLNVLFQFEESILTRSMVNNYVKHKMMPAPQKKRYQQEHLVYIITISILKSIFSIGNISSGIEGALNQYDIDVAYDMFVESIEESLKMLVNELYQYDLKLETTERIRTPLKAATLAFAAKILANYTFNAYVQKENTHE